MTEKNDIRSILVKIIESSIKNAENSNHSELKSASIIEKTFPGFGKIRDDEKYADIRKVYFIIDEFEDSVTHGFSDSDDYKELLLVLLEYLKRNVKIDVSVIDAFFERRKPK